MAFIPRLPQLQQQYKMTSFKQPKRTSNDILKGMIGNLAGSLKPVDRFSDQYKYNEFSSPYRQMYSTFASENLRPEFDRYTYNPFMRQTANQYAASNASMMGGARDLFEREREQVEQQYFAQAEQARQIFENLARKAYEDRAKKYYTSPATFNL